MSFGIINGGEFVAIGDYPASCMAACYELSGHGRQGDEIAIVEETEYTPRRVVAYMTWPNVLRHVVTP